MRESAAKGDDVNCMQAWAGQSTALARVDPPARLSLDLAEALLQSLVGAWRLDYPDPGFRLCEAGQWLI
jgi:hypothetical protein